jgi:hypothetical protein
MLLSPERAEWGPSGTSPEGTRRGHHPRDWDGGRRAPRDLGRDRAGPRDFLLMFQKKGTGEISTPLRLSWKATGWNHWP